jgi:hypothetical protein
MGLRGKAPTLGERAVKQIYSRSECVCKCALSKLRDCVI